MWNRPATMILYKAWRESRTRFLLSAGSLVAFCLLAVLLQNQIRAHALLPGRRASNYSEHIYTFVYSGVAKSILILFLFFLGAGGLLRERACGAAPFTLALPVSRFALVASRAVIGLVELGILSLLPALLIPALSPLAHQSYPWLQALHFSALWFACGSVIFAVTFLFATFLGGEYTASIACFLAFLVHDEAMMHFKLYSWKIAWIMGEFGTMHWDPRYQVLVSSPLNWMVLITYTLIAIGFVFVASGIAQRQDF